jgi:uncharacterized membrane protein YhfC
LSINNVDVVAVLFAQENRVTVVCSWLLGILDKLPRPWQLSLPCSDRILNLFLNNKVALVIYIFNAVRRSYCSWNLINIRFHSLRVFGAKDYKRKCSIKIIWVPRSAVSL